jgi:two-component system phosphate regulon sensor histidine kinase PhoR
LTVRHRLLTVLTVASLAGAILVAVASAALIREAVRGRFVDRIRAETALLAEWVEQEERIDYQDFCVRAAARLGLRVTLIDVEGTVLADSSRDLAGVAAMDNHAGRPEVLAARLSGTGDSFRTSATTNVEYFYSARVVAGDRLAKYVRIALPSTEVYRVQSRYSLLVVAMVPVAMLLLSALGYAAVRRLSRPIERMAAAVDRSARGDLQLELPADGGEEIERLGNAVSVMREALIEKLDELGTERALLSSVVEGMREGLLLVGADGRVRLANEPLRRTLDLAFDPAGHSLAEVVRHPVVLQDIETALTRGVEVRESILRLPSGRSFQVRTTPLNPSGQGGADAAIVLFFDITRLEKLESVRREFVANVSHELRTPLTSIKAFVETLLEGGRDDPENAERFLGIIRKHADRMGALIEDLTDLSLIETGAISLELCDVDAADVVRGVLEELQPLAARREIDVRSELPAPFPVRADRRRLEEMVTNLLDNAIKFSDTGGRVRVRGRTGETGVTLIVEDEGTGIPAESLDKVFHRFYQENRDASREMGGTGLGLSIVKHLMRLHGGVVRVESELGRGSTFYLEFPPPPANALRSEQTSA